MKPHVLTVLLIVGLLGGSQTWANELPETVTVQIASEVEMQFCLIPTGQFVMGSPPDEAGRHGDEGPQHEVTISKPFYFGQYEVTQKQWLALMDHNPSLFAGKMNNPVEQVTWNETQAYIEKLNALGIGTFRLPTEAEWEHACRAGTQTRFHWGDDPDYELVYQYSWFNPITHAKTQPVGQKKPNPWGLYDITGNVWEWCQDWKGPYTADAKTDPRGPATGEVKCFRGSSWYDIPAMHRSANRHGHAVDERYSTVGFRLVKVIEQ